MSKCKNCKNCMTLLSEETVLLSHNRQKSKITSENIYTTMCLLSPNTRLQNTQAYVYANVIECNQFKSIEVN